MVQRLASYPACEKLGLGTRLYRDMTYIVDDLLKVWYHTVYQGTVVQTLLQCYRLKLTLQVFMTAKNLIGGGQVKR